MKVNCMIAAVVVFAVFSFAVNDVRAHMHNMMKYASVMSPNMNFQLQWAYNNETGMLYFKLKCKNTGWCGVGFADSTVNQDGANMMSYDVAIGGFATAGYLSDFWSTSKIRPMLDTLQNVTLIEAREMDGYTMVDFTRPASSSDPKDVAIMNDTDVWIMFGSATTEATDTNTFLKHSVRERLTMKYNLIATAMAAAAAPDPPVTTTVTTTGSAAKCGGSYAVASVILALTARFVLSS